MKKLNKIIGVIAISTLLQNNSINKRQERVDIDSYIKKKIKDNLKNINPDFKINSIIRINNCLYEVVFNKRNIIYFISDGKYFLDGELYKIESNIPVNLTELTKNKQIAETNKKIAESLQDKKSAEFISFKANKEKYSVYVFIDITCGYCKKFHEQIKNYNELGITINYLAYPILSKNSEEKMVKIWCSHNPKETLINYFNDINYTLTNSFNIKLTKKCINIVVNHLKIGQELGINSTPAIMFKDGTVIGGYVKPKVLLEALNQNSTEKKKKKKRQNEIELDFDEGILITDEVMGGLSKGEKKFIKEILPKEQTPDVLGADGILATGYELAPITPEAQLIFEPKKKKKILNLSGTVSIKNNGGFIQIRFPLTIQIKDYKGIKIVCRKNHDYKGSYHIRIRTNKYTKFYWHYYSAEILPGKKNFNEINIKFTDFKQSGILLPKKLKGSLKSLAVVALGKDFYADIDIKSIKIY